MDLSAFLVSFTCGPGGLAAFSADTSVSGALHQLLVVVGGC